VNYLTIKIFANIFKYIWRGFQHMQRAMSTVDVIIYLVLGLVLILGIMIIQGGTIGKFMKNILGIGEEGISQIQVILVRTLPTRAVALRVVMMP